MLSKTLWQLMVFVYTQEKGVHSLSKAAGTSQETVKKMSRWGPIFFFIKVTKEERVVFFYFRSRLKQAGRGSVGGDKLHSLSDKSTKSIKVQKRRMPKACFTFQSSAKEV